MSDKLQVLIAEDEELISNSLSIVIGSDPGMNVVGIARNGLEAYEKVMEHQPDLVLMDIQMPGMDGIECIKRLRAARYEGIILILTAYSDEHYIIEGLAGGATGYLLKTPHYRSMLNTIREAMSGQYILPAEIAAKVVRHIRENGSMPNANALASLANSLSLSPREKEIVPMLLERCSNKEIADALYVSEGTVKNYLTVIYEKLGVKNRGEAVQYLKAQLG